MPAVRVLAVRECRYFSLSNDRSAIGALAATLGLIPLRSRDWWLTDESLKATRQMMSKLLPSLLEDGETAWWRSSKIWLMEEHTKKINHSGSDDDKGKHRGSIWCECGAVMRGVRYSLAILMVVNFIAVMLNSIIYLQATTISRSRQASLLVERLERNSFCALYNFLACSYLFAGDYLWFPWVAYRSQTSRWSIFDKWNRSSLIALDTKM